MWGRQCLFNVMLDILRDLMHVCMSLASAFFPFMIRKNELRYLCLPWYHAGPFLLCGVRRRVTRVPDQVRPRGMYTSPPGGSMYAYMGRVWRSTTHPTLPRIEKRPRLCKVYEKLGPPHMLHVFAFLTPTVGWLNEYFIKYSSHVLPTFLR